MNIHNEPTLFKPYQIKIIEEKYNGTYVFESCIKTKDGGWTDRAFAIFYTEEPHPEGSNYFAIGRDYSTSLIKKMKLIISNGISATEEFQGVQYKDDVYYSRYCHDFRQCTRNLFVDGGRDYLRIGGSVLDQVKHVNIRVNKDKLEVVE